MTFSSANPDGIGELVWLKLRSLQVFWPACIFDGYSEAVDNSLDPAALRNLRPVLAHDEHVVYFFGVGPCGCLVRSTTGPAPTLQLCVAREDDMTCVPYTGEADQFAQLCREHLISDDLVQRAEKNLCFIRAFDEALAYKYSVTDVVASSEYFVSLLTSIKQIARSPSRSLKRSSQDAGAKAQKASAAASPSRAGAATSPAAPTTKAAAAPPQFFSPPHVKLSRALLSSPSPSKKVLAGLERALPTFWKHMLACGWETLTQSDGVVLYKKPGVSFFDLRPNENVFDSLVKAFNAFVREWAPTLTSSSSTVTDATDATDDANTRLVEALWVLAEQSGWTKITAANETWYIMPDTPFNACVPNVTIFQSQTDVVAKFLAQAGILELSSSNDVTESLAMDVDDDEAAADSDDVMGESDTASADEDVGERSSDDEDESAKEEEVAVVAPPKPAKARVRTKPQPKTKMATVAPATKQQPKPLVKQQPKPVATAVASAAATASSAAKKLTFESKPQVPPFKCTFGKIEVELRARGWFWKPSQLDWTYFKPHCTGQDKSALAAGLDYFDGRWALEEYLKVSGEMDEIRDALERAHRARYADQDDAGDASDADEFDNAPLASSKKRVTAKKAVARSSSGDADKENRSSNIVARSARIAKQTQTSANRTSSRGKRGRSGASSAAPIDTASVKFGEVWSVLERQGWHFREGKFEYDYFRPGCRDASAGEPGVDYFVSKSMLIDHLRSSGIWNKVAQQVAHEAAMDLTSSDDDDGDVDTGKNDISKPQAQTPAAKSPVANRQALKRRSSGLSERKSPAAAATAVVDDKTPKTQRASKKARVSGTFRTPPEHRRSTAADASAAESDGHESDKADKISPEASSQRTTMVAAAHDSSNSGSSNLPRKLADCFTPSPGQAKKSRATTTTTTQVTSPLARFTNAIQRLSLGYSVPSFEHRNDEAQRIATFFRTCFTQRRGASMYISGAPGCGKTALLKASEDRIAELYQEAHGVQDTKLLVRCHVNAMALADANKLFCDLATKLTAQVFDDGERAFEAIERATSTANKRCKTMVLVLDEIDVLLKKNGVERELCRLFELAHREAHAFILLGIANQVDFTERHLPLLAQQLPACKPDVVIFQPYTHAAIEQILTARLGGRDAALQMLNAHGISFLARKIASTSGDVRLALDICRRVLQHRVDAASSASASGGDDSLLLTPVPLTDMLRLVKASLESKSAQAVQSLPRTLQMILFASTRLVATLELPASGSGSGSTVGDASGSAGALFSLEELYACYCDVSQEAGVYKPLTYREYKRSLETLASEGLLGAAELKKQLVKLLYAPSELLQNFRSDAYFARLV